MNRFAILLVFCLTGSIAGREIYRIAKQPIITQSYGLTLERDDFPPAAPVLGTNTIFQTSVSARSSFALVYRNGLLQRPCSGSPSGPCDYVQSGNVTITYPPGSIQSGDLVTVLFQR